jgi:MFS family permease
VPGDGVFITAAPLLAASLTANPTSVAAVTMAGYLPWLLAGLPAGALVDRWPRRLVMMVADVSRAVVLAVTCILFVLGRLDLVSLVCAVVVIGVAQCFFDPAAQSIVPAVVGRDKSTLDRVNGRLSALDLFGRAMIGPLFGSLLFTVWRALPFVADAVSFVISATFVRRLPTLTVSAEPRESIGRSIADGFRLLFRSRELLILSLGLAASNFGYSAAIATLVLYARNVLHVGALGFGSLFTFLACGGIISGWVGTKLIRGWPAGYIQVASLTVQASVWFLVTLFANFWVTAALFSAIGAIVALNSTSIRSSRQKLAPDGALGRVAATFRLFSLGAGTFGALVGGGVASWFGLSAPMITAAVIQLTAAVVVWMSWRRWAAHAAGQ